MLHLAPAPPRSLPCPPTVSLSFNNTPRLPFLSLHLLIFHFSLSLYSSCLHSLCPIGIRVGDDISILQVHPHHHGKSYSFSSPIPFPHAKRERKRVERIKRKKMTDKRRKQEKTSKMKYYVVWRKKQQMMMKMGFKVKALTDGMSSSSSVSWPLEDPGFP